MIPGDWVERALDNDRAKRATPGIHRITLGESTVRALIEALRTYPDETPVGTFNDLSVSGEPIKTLADDGYGTLTFYDWDLNQ